ncbi:phosphotransferase family protein [Pseudonocardia ailaonensis]|uniref:Phosphotransferase family protein n=1 Tax=Pseudonocardia ailaonensis TaxID=367279 RepID=A0ABN2MZR5_9PSEU
MTRPDTLPVAGLDLDRLEPWFRRHVLGVAGGLTATLLTGGMSNLTFLVTDGSRSWVVRRPPLGHVLATAHDMSREFRVMTALRDTGVPVPAAHALCDDLDVLGAPFYVMEYVAGRPFRHAHELAGLGTNRTRAVSTALVDTLAALHRIDPADVGLADFGRPAGFPARQVRRWRKQLDASRSRELPDADRLHAALVERTPADARHAIVHGDYRLDNVLVDDVDRVAAVVDWEMSTLGDPLTDVALLVLYTRLPELLPGHPAVADAPGAPGFLTADALAGRYAESSGHDLGDFGFYLGLAAFKLAVINEGIHYRFLAKKTVGDGFDRAGEAVPPLLEFGIAALER